MLPLHELIELLDRQSHQLQEDRGRKPLGELGHEVATPLRDKGFDQFDGALSDLEGEPIHRPGSKQRPQLVPPLLVLTAVEHLRYPFERRIGVDGGHRAVRERLGVLQDLQDALVVEHHPEAGAVLVAVPGVFGAQLVVGLHPGAGSLGLGVVEGPDRALLGRAFDSRHDSTSLDHRVMESHY